MDRPIKNAVVLERVGEGKIMLELIKGRRRNWLGHWLRRNCLLMDALEGMVNRFCKPKILVFFKINYTNMYNYVS